MTQLDNKPITRGEASIHYAVFEMEEGAGPSDAFVAGAKWQKEQCAELVKEALNKFQTAVKLLDTLVYYSHIKMVSGVRPANMVTHEQASKAAQQWLHDNCVIKDGEYFLINPEQLQDLGNSTNNT